MTARCIYFFIQALQDTLANPTNPAKSSLNQVRALLDVEYGNTTQRHGIVLVKWSFQKQAMLYQNYTNIYQVTLLQSNVST